VVGLVRKRCLIYSLITDIDSERCSESICTYNHSKTGDSSFEKLREVGQTVIEQVLYPRLMGALGRALRRAGVERILYALNYPKRVPKERNSPEQRK